MSKPHWTETSPTIDTLESGWTIHSAPNFLFVKKPNGDVVHVSFDCIDDAHDYIENGFDNANDHSSDECPCCGSYSYY